MGEAKRRGTYEERKQRAIARNKEVREKIKKIYNSMLPIGVAVGLAKELMRQEIRRQRK